MSPSSTCRHRRWTRRPAPSRRNWSASFARTSKTANRVSCCSTGGGTTRWWNVRSVRPWQDAPTVRSPWPTTPQTGFWCATTAVIRRVRTRPARPAGASSGGFRERAPRRWRRSCGNCCRRRGCSGWIWTPLWHDFPMKNILLIFRRENMI